MNTYVFTGGIGAFFASPAFGMNIPSALMMIGVLVVLGLAYRRDRLMRADRVATARKVVRSLSLEAPDFPGVDMEKLVKYDGPAGVFYHATIRDFVYRNDPPAHRLFYGDHAIQFEYDGYPMMEADAAIFVVDALVKPAAKAWPFSDADGVRARANLDWLHARGESHRTVFNFDLQAPKLPKDYKPFSMTLPNVSEGVGGTYVGPSLVMIIIRPYQKTPVAEGLVFAYADGQVEFFFHCRFWPMSDRKVVLAGPMRTFDGPVDPGLLKTRHARRVGENLTWFFKMHRPLGLGGFGLLRYDEKPITVVVDLASQK